MHDNVWLNVVNRDGRSRPTRYARRLQSGAAAWRCRSFYHRRALAGGGGGQRRGGGSGGGFPLRGGMVAGRAEPLSAFGRQWGRPELIDQARLADKNPPRLDGEIVEFHPAYHRFMAD